MGSYNDFSDWRVWCPFYRYTKDNIIHCENKHFSIRANPEDVKEWKKENCEKPKALCPIRKALYKEYEEKE